MKTLLLETMNVKQFEQITPNSITMILITLIVWKTSWQKIHLILQYAAVHLILQNSQKNRYRIYVDKKDLDQAKALLHHTVNIEE